MTPEEKYLADVHRLELLLQKLPTVDRSFMLSVASMSREDLQEKVMIGSDWIGHFQKSLDGIKEIFAIGGGGIDGCRGHQEVRAIVETLVRHCPLTFEKSYQGEPKE